MKIRDKVLTHIKTISMLIHTYIHTYKSMRSERRAIGLIIALFSITSERRLFVRGDLVG